MSAALNPVAVEHYRRLREAWIDDINDAIRRERQPAAIPTRALPTGAMILRGDYTATGNYRPGDVVTHDTITYVALTPAPATAPVTPGTDAAVWMVVGGGTTGGGGGTGVVLYDADLPPVTANALDDEFTSGTLAAAWTVATSGTAPTHDQQVIPSRLRVKYPYGVASGISFTRPFAPAGDFTAVVKLSASNIANGSTQGFHLKTAGTPEINLLCQHDTSSSRFMTVDLQGDLGGGFTRWGQQQEFAEQTMYLLLARVGTTYSGYVSDDGATWLMVGRVVSTITIASFQLTAATAGADVGGYGHADEVSFDFVRFNWIDKATHVAGPQQAAGGVVGPPGPPGAGGATYVHNQLTPATTWTIAHGFGQWPSVTVVDSGGNVVVGGIDYVDANTVQLTFSAAFGGKAFLNL